MGRGESEGGFVFAGWRRFWIRFRGPTVLIGFSQGKLV